MTKSTNVLYIYDQSDDCVARKGPLEDTGRAEDHIIADSTPKELQFGGA